eukprot:scpid74325/ scgid4275/ 
MRTYPLVQRLCILVTSVALAREWGSHAKTISGNATLGSIPSLDVAKCSGIEPYDDMGVLIVGSTGMIYVFNSTQLFRTYTLTIDSWTAATSLTFMCRIPRLLSPGQHLDACIAPTVSSCITPQNFGPTLNCKYSEVAVTVQKKDLGHSICFVVKEASSFDDPVKKICIRLVDGTPVVQTTPSPTPSPSPTAPTTTPTIITTPPPTTSTPSIATTEPTTTPSIATTKPVTTAVTRGDGPGTGAFGDGDKPVSTEQPESSSGFQIPFYVTVAMLALAVLIIFVLAIGLTLAHIQRRVPHPPEIYQRPDQQEQHDSTSSATYDLEMGREQQPEQCPPNQRPAERASKETVPGRPLAQCQSDDSTVAGTTRTNGEHDPDDSKVSGKADL